MNCEQFALMLDAYIDGELTAEELTAFTEHAKSCEVCGRELEAAALLKDALLHMDDELNVPLAAQAAWRNAVRMEAKKKNGRKWLRVAYAAAAALVLVVGAGAAFRTASMQDADMQNVNMNVRMAADIIEADGGVQLTSEPDEAATNYTAWKKVAVDSADEAFKTLEALAEEYNANYSKDAQGICRIELPYEYMQDFLSAASRMGDELNSEILEAESETALIMIQINEKVEVEAK